MSKIVKVSYQGISIECQAICDNANKQLCRVTTLLQQLETGAKTLANEETESLKNELHTIKLNLENQIKLVVSSAKDNENKESFKADLDYNKTAQLAYRPLDEAKNLKAMTNELLYERYGELEALFNNLLKQRLNQNTAKMYDKAYGICRENPDFTANLNKIDDAVLKQYIYLEWMKDNEANFDDLLSKAKTKMTQTTAEYHEETKSKQIEEIKNDLKSSGVSKEIIEEITNEEVVNNSNILEIREKATDEIVGESIRKSTLKVIKKSIEKRGFIVGDIKLQRETNEVVLVAQKPHGEKVEFKVSLDGKFVYHFDGYEGQACQEDITPFMDDLENIYGIKVISQEEIWGNPDKHANNQMQSMEQNYNKN